MHDTLVVLGGSGFLGTHVRREAARHAVRLVALGREEPLGRLAELRPRAIVCCSALSRLADCRADPARARAVNAELPQRLAQASQELGARLVHVSTDLVFGGELAGSARYAEGAATDPRSEYGRTKALGEELVLRANPAALVVRCSLLGGDSFGRGLGAEDSLYAAIARGERPVCFEDEWRTPIDAAEAARALVLLALLREPHGLLHLGGEERLSRWEIGLRALHRAGLSAAHLRRGTRAEAGLASERPADVSLDSARARELGL